MKKSVDNKIGQMKLSFGMIFSIFLIIVFIVFGFFAINKFLCWQKDIQAGNFVNGFQNDIDNLWKSTEGSRTVSYVLPRNVERVCIASDSKIYIDPAACSVDLAEFQIKNIDLEKIMQRTSGRDFCVETENNRIKFVIQKGYRDALVDVTRG